MRLEQNLESKKNLQAKQDLSFGMSLNHYSLHVIKGSPTGGTQELLSVIPLRPTATLDYAEAVPARAEPNGQPRCAITIPQYQLIYGPGESRHWWGAGGYSGVSNSWGQSQVYPSAPQDAWAVAQRSRGPRAARRPAPPQMHTRMQPALRSARPTTAQSYQPKSPQQSARDPFTLSGPPQPL